MKRKAQPMLSEDGQQPLDQYRQVLQQAEDLSPIPARNYLSDLCQFITWYEGSWREEQEDCRSILQAVFLSLITHYQECLQITLDLKLSTVDRALTSLKRYFAWTRKTQSHPASLIKFVPKEVPSLRYLDNDEKEVLVAAVNAAGTLRDQTIITLLLYTGLHMQAMCILTCQQVHLGKRNGAQCITTPYATQDQVTDTSPHDLRLYFDYQMAAMVSLQRLTQIMGHDSLDTTTLHIRRTKQDLEQDVEKIAWK